MEQEWPAGLSERQIAKFVEDDEVHAGQVVGEPALAAGASFGLEPVDEIDHVVEPAAGTATDAASGDGDGQVGLAGTGPADQHGVALLGDEAAAGEVVDERFVDRRALELEVVEVLGERQLGDGELVLDRARLLLVDRIPPVKAACRGLPAHDIMCARKFANQWARMTQATFLSGP